MCPTVKEGAVAGAACKGRPPWLQPQILLLILLLLWSSISQGICPTSSRSSSRRSRLSKVRGRCAWKGLQEFMICWDMRYTNWVQQHPCPPWSWAKPLQQQKEQSLSKDQEEHQALQDNQKQQQRGLPAPAPPHGWMQQYQAVDVVREG
jgi:hypothetical protein